MSESNLAATLEEAGNHLLGRPLSPAESGHLQAYLELLQHWNFAYNLTSIREPGEMVVRHLLDSLSVLPFIADGPVLDAGTGAGLPGIPLAILKPDQQFTLLDSIGKKVRFLRQVKRELGLTNIHPVQARLEEHMPVQPYEVIISRAFSSLAEFAASSRHLMAAGTRLLAMKGQDPQTERQQLPAWIQVDSVQELLVPGLQEQRHLVIMSLSQ